MSKTRIASLIFITSLSLSACQVGTGVPNIAPSQNQPSNTSEQPLELAQNWVELVRTLVKDNKVAPPAAARIYAYTSVGLYEATRTAYPELKSLAGHLNRLESLPQAEDNVSLALGIHHTMRPLVEHFFGSDPEGTQNALKSLESQLMASTEFQGLSGSQKSQAQNFGQNLAKALIEWSEGDGYSELKDKEYTLPDFSQNPALWQPTAPDQAPLEPFWGELKTLSLTSVETCPSTPTVNFSTEVDSDFYKQAQEVQNAVNNLTQDENDIANWWADNPGETATPPGHWMGIIGHVGHQQKWTLPQLSKTYMLTGVTLMDSFIACWASKYDNNLVRPVTYIHNIIGDKEWATAIGTPPFPEFPSGHSTGSGAAAEMLTHLWGDLSFEDPVNTGLGIKSRRFESFNQAAQEAAISRLYGGIHYRDAIDQGVGQGQCVTQNILKNIGDL